MMRSLWAGVSGLQNHQTRMDVIGNNISNVNTTGFKKGRVNFHDMISQNIQGAARPTDELGGVNPKQVGLGMTIASIDTIHTQGNLQSTGVTTDVAIQGNGFFVLKQGEREFYTRAGNFAIDREGTLVNPANGMRVQGWTPVVVDGQPILRTSATPGDLVIPVGQKEPAKATQNVFFASNLNKNFPLIPENPGAADILRGTWVIDSTIYDNTGQKYLLQTRLTRVADQPNQWQAQVFIDPTQDPPEGDPVTTFTIQFSNLGLLESVTTAEGNTITQGQVQVSMTFNLKEANANADGTAATQTLNLNIGTIGGVTNSMTQFADRPSTKSYFQDGYTMGYLETFQIDQSGVITGVYSNGVTRPLGQIAMASFTNPGGLEKAGENTFIVTNNSGQALIGESGSAGKGKIISGTLEMSNVDLTEAFTDMIVTQRGFQANSKTINTSDQMLQEILTLKR